MERHVLHRADEDEAPRRRGRAASPSRRRPPPRCRGARGPRASAACPARARGRTRPLAGAAARGTPTLASISGASSASSSSGRTVPAGSGGVMLRRLVHLRLLVVVVRVVVGLDDDQVARRAVSAIRRGVYRSGTASLVEGVAELVDRDDAQRVARDRDDPLGAVLRRERAAVTRAAGRRAARCASACWLSTAPTAATRGRAPPRRRRAGCGRGAPAARRGSACACPRAAPSARRRRARSITPFDRPIAR